MTPADQIHQAQAELDAAKTLLAGTNEQTKLFRIRQLELAIQQAESRQLAALIRLAGF